ncbi:MAG: UDP-N-acetylglucosamine 4,6-dehydratase (inverting) [Desulfamplus sp.]|nr:UDP-N-acetylglucosamine 4,6-dehydratase (inverting) [Desulfamplus sp.]
MEFKIKDVSEKIEVPMSTIRYWEKEFSEFINPEKTAGGQRRYSRQDVTTFFQIKTILHDHNNSISQAKILLGQGNTNPGEIDWENKKVLITGGTGSFGQFFCRYLLSHHPPKAIRVYSRDELKQYEMRQNINNTTIRYLIGDVRDFPRLKRAMEGVDIVVHAAALKQVPACEYNPFEAVKTNVIGAQHVIDAAIDVGVKKVLALSTDKAANPVNLYGATKLCAEKIFISGNSYTGQRSTIFSCARYGNVIGSRGSVVPLFNKQKETGKLTVTDARMTRFWITLEQASQFVINAIQYMQGGEIFIPKLPSMRIDDLAKAVAPECQIEYIGIRPGEKLHETLITEEEGCNTIEFNNQYIILPTNKWWTGGSYKDAKGVPDNFLYKSDTNKEILSIDCLQKIVSQEL